LKVYGIFIIYPILKGDMTATFLWLHKNHTEKTPLVKHEIKKTKAEFSITTIRRV
jgi:hypothetical protein